MKIETKNNFDLAVFYNLKGRNKKEGGESSFRWGGDERGYYINLDIKLDLRPDLYLDNRNQFFGCDYKCI